MPQFDAVIRHIHDGVTSMSISAAVKNIEGWETTLSAVETPGAKAIIRDLESLKKHLRADEIDSDAVRKLIGKLGHETVTLAGKADSEEAIRALGEALTEAAEAQKAE